LHCYTCCCCCCCCGKCNSSVKTTTYSAFILCTLCSDGEVILVFPSICMFCLKPLNAFGWNLVLDNYTKSCKANLISVSTAILRSNWALYSENCIINKRDAQKLEAAQMRFLRPLLGLTRLDRQRNPDICNRLKVDNLVEDIKLYQKNWLDHLKQMETAYQN